MKIKIEETTNGFRADCLDLTGSPPIGVGKTKEMAVAHLFFIIIFSRCGLEENSNWVKQINGTNEIIINDERWEFVAPNIEKSID